MSFSRTIINWYNQNKRDLPWRRTKDPYFIWISEVILQQTRVDQGLSYYNRFVERFPNVNSLANAKEHDVIRMWQGLGYYSRARNLHAAAIQIKKNFGGKFPHTYENIRSLKGVGDYTAAAISSISYNLEYPVVDGNVYRLLSRYFGIDAPIDTSEGKKTFTKLAGELIKGFHPATFNQAIMEFGARQCKPASPDCSICPLNLDCVAFRKNKIQDLPVKKNKTKTRNRYFNYLVLNQDNTFYIKKRTEKDIWRGLHDFPLIETSRKISEAKVNEHSEWKKILGKNSFILINISQEYKHLLSHQKIHARFYEIKINSKKFSGATGWLKVNRTKIKKYALPKLIENYLIDQKLISNGISD